MAGSTAYPECPWSRLAGTAGRALAPLALAVLLLLVPSPGRAQAPQGSGDAAKAAADQLRPGDVVRLRIWREPDLSGDFPVDETGVVVFPKIGPLPVTEESAQSLEARLVAAYEEFLQHTSVDVTLLRRLQVLGAVRNPGLYSVDATMTVGDVLAMAGGVTVHGSAKRIELIRDGARVTGDLSGSARLSEVHVRSGDQVHVPERSWLSRNTGVVAAGLSATVSLVIALLTR